MHGILDVALRQFIVPQTGATNFTTFANKQVPFANSKLWHLGLSYPHLLHVTHIRLELLGEGSQ